MTARRQMLFWALGAAVALALLALIALMTWRRSRRAAQLAERLVDRIERTTRKTGNYPGRLLTRSRWLAEASRSSS